MKNQWVIPFVDLGMIKETYYITRGKACFSHEFVVTLVTYISVGSTTINT